MELIEYARKKVPGITFSSDIIVGFPGETEEDFQGTLELVKKSATCNCSPLSTPSALDQGSGNARPHPPRGEN